jgi:outer membrane protein assembly factor BamD (BamD/ComL family)
MVDNAQYKTSANETVEDINQIIRDEIKKAFETVNIPTATTPLKPEESEPEKNLLEKAMCHEPATDLIEDAIRALNNNNSKEAITYLGSANERIEGNQTSKLFIDRAIRAIKNDNLKEAINTLKLAYGI